jgi:hypothetical protein
MVMRSLSALCVLLCAPQDAEKPQELKVTLGLQEALREWSGGPRTYVVEGTCPLPDDFVLRVDIAWNLDTVTDAGELAAVERNGQTLRVQVREGKFKIGFLLRGSGIYRADVSIPWRVDQPPLSDAQRKSLVLRDKWRFEVGVWTLDLPEQWAARMSALRELIADIRTYVDALEAATVTEDLWIEKREALRSKGRELSIRAMGKRALETELPATQEYLRFAANALDKGSAHFIFRDGKLAGSGEPNKGLAFGQDGGGIWWNGLRQAMDELKKIAGREAALWTVKLLRATPEMGWAEIRNSIARTKLTELEPLRACKAADLDAIETTLRAPTVEARQK